MPETHLNNRQRQTQWADTHRTNTPVRTPSYIRLIRYLHHLQLLIFTSHHIIETPVSIFQIIRSLLSTFPRTYKCPRARLVKWAIFTALTDLLTASLCPGPICTERLLRPSHLRCPPAMCAILNGGGAQGSLDLNQTMNELSLSGIGALGDRQTDWTHAWSKHFIQPWRAACCLLSTAQLQIRDWAFVQAARTYTFWHQ